MPLIGCLDSLPGDQLWQTFPTRLPWLSIQEYRAPSFCNWFRKDDYKWCNHRLIALNIGPSRQHYVVAYAPTRPELETDLQRIESLRPHFGDQPSSARLREVISALMSGTPLPAPEPFPSLGTMSADTSSPSPVSASSDAPPHHASPGHTRPVDFLGDNKLKRFFSKNLIRIYRMNIDQLRHFRDHVVPKKIDPELQPVLIPIVNQRLAELTVAHTAALSLDQLLEERQALLCCYDDSLRLALYQPLLEQTIVQRAREEYAATDSADVLWAKKHLLTTSGDPVLISPAVAAPQCAASCPLR